MGRGLSELQRWILTRALDAPDRRGAGGCDLSIARTLSEFYGLPFKHDRFIARRFKGTGVIEEAKQHRPAVSRAFARLANRGLVELMVGASRWAGINLTDEGKQRARELSIVEGSDS